MMGVFASLLAAFGMGQPPGEQAIIEQAVRCGLSPEQISFFEDDDGLTNVDVSPLPGDGEEYLDKVECLMVWAAEKRVPLGVSYNIERE